MVKKVKKYGVKNVAGSFGKAFSAGGKGLLEMHKKRKEYLASPEYKRKVEAARSKQLAEIDYQIKLARKQKALSSARGVQNAKLRRQINKPMGYDIGSERDMILALKWD